MHTKSPYPKGWRQLAQLSGCVLTAGLLSGCTISVENRLPEVTTVEVPLAPKVNEPLKEPVKASLDLAPARDTQWTEDKCSLVHLEDAKRSYVAKKPLAEIFQDGLSNALRQNGFMSTNRSRYVLHTELQAFGWLPIKTVLPPEYQKFGLTTGYDDVPPEFRMPGSSLLDDGPPRRLAVLVVFQLFNPEAKRPAWSFNPQPVWEFTCYGKLQTPEYFMPYRFGEAFARTAEDAIRQLIMDQEFRSFFEIQNTNAP
jgi:hypothetical protein